MHTRALSGPPVLGGWNMLTLNVTGDAQRPPTGASDEAALKAVASELLYPLTVIKLNAEELLQQFRNGQEDAATVDAAQALLRSVERMSHIVQVLIEDEPPGSAQTRRPDQAAQ